jgi:hypothetical protein
MLITIVVVIAALGYAAYKHFTVAEIKAEVAKIEAETVTDVNTVLYRIKAKL